MKVEPVMLDTYVQCHIDIIIYDCHIPTMKVEPVMLDTHVQCHIDMIIYDCHIPTMKVEPVMLDTSQCHIDSCSMSHRHCNVGYSCAMSHRHDNT